MPDTTENEKTPAQKRKIPQDIFAAFIVCLAISTLAFLISPQLLYFSTPILLFSSILIIASLEGKRETTLFRIVLGISLVGSCSPFLMYVEALTWTDPVWFSLAPLPIQIPAALIAVSLITVALKVEKRVTCRRVYLTLIFFVISAIPATFFLGPYMYPIAYEAAVRTKMLGSLDMETLQADAVFAIQKHADELKTKRAIGFPGYYDTPLSGNGGKRVPPEYLMTEYTVLKPRRIAIHKKFGNEPCLFLDYEGGGFSDNFFGIIIGSPTFVFHEDWPLKWKWADGIYFFRDKDRYRGNAPTYDEEEMLQNYWNLEAESQTTRSLTR